MYTGNTNGETAKAGIKLFGATITLHGGGGGGGPRQQRHQHHHRQVIKQEHERNNQVMLLQGHGESISNTITTSSGSSSDRQECHEQTETALLDDHKRAAAEKIIGCPRCRSMDTKFCYFNNYNVNQPRHFCKGCQRYWTAGGALRNVPVGAGRRKSKPPPPGHGRGAGLGVPTGFYNNDQVLLHQLELLDGVVIKEWQVAPAAFPNVLPLPAVKRRRGDPATGDQLSSNLLFPFSSPFI